MYKVLITKALIFLILQIASRSKSKENFGEPGSNSSNSRNWTVDYFLNQQALYPEKKKLLLLFSLKDLNLQMEKTSENLTHFKVKTGSIIGKDLHRLNLKYKEFFFLEKGIEIHAGIGSDQTVKRIGNMIKN